MRKVLFEIPVIGLPIHSYGLMIMVGALLAMYLAAREGRRKGIEPARFYDFGIAMVLTGILGSRIFYYVQNYSAKFEGEPWYAFFEIWKGGLVLYGGVLGGVLAGLAYIAAARMPLWATLDTAAPFAALGHGFGRLGCFMFGCCYGGPCDDAFALGVSFPGGSPPADDHGLLGYIPPGAGGGSLAVHPTQLYAAAHALLLCGILWFYLRRSPPGGAVTALLGVLYGIGRFVLELVRADMPVNWTGMTTAGAMSVVLTGGCGLLLVRRLTRGGGSGLGTSPKADSRGKR